MTTLALIQTLRRQGVGFALVDGKLRVLQPRSRPLSEEEKAEVRRHKDEIVRRLKSGGVTPADVTAMFPGAKDVTATASWLKAKLSTPQHIADVITEWVGTVDRPTGRDVDTLMQVRWACGVEAYAGRDGRMWWRLPQKTVQ